MNIFGKNFDYTSIITGDVKEPAFKYTGNEQLESKGKMQISKADLNKNMNYNKNETIADRILRNRSKISN